LRALFTATHIISLARAAVHVRSFQFRSFKFVPVFTGPNAGYPDTRHTSMCGIDYDTTHIGIYRLQYCQWTR
jgi:hypothetical protein